MNFFLEPKMSLNFRSRAEMQVEKERNFSKMCESRAFLNYCLKGNYSAMKSMLRQDPELFHCVNDANQTPLEIAILEGHTNVVECLYKSHRKETNKLLKEHPRIFFEALEREMVEFVEAIASSMPAILETTNSYGENATFVACKTFNLSIIKHFYKLNPELIKHKNKDKQTPFAYVASQNDHGYPVLEWMIRNCNYEIANSSDAKALCDHLHTNMFFDETLLLKAITEESLPNFLPHLKSLFACLEQEEVVEHLTRLLAPYPEGFYYEPKPLELLEGDDLIEFCNAHIPEPAGEKNPFKSLRRLFFCIKKTEYIALMSFDGTRATQEQVSQQKRQDLTECAGLFGKVKQETQFKNAYLIRILKHLAAYLKTREGSKEKIVFLKDLCAAAPYCYTHYSTILRSIYSRISGDQAFGQMQVRLDAPDKVFETKLTQFLKKKFCEQLLRMHGDWNVHCTALAVRFLKEENLPVPCEAIIDDEIHLTPSLLLFRQELFNIEFEEEHEEMVNVEAILYEDTKDKYIQLVNEKLLSLDFIYNLTLDFLTQGLGEEDSAVFLAQFVAWCESKHLSVHRILRYKQEDVYQVKKTGVLEILSKFPKLIKV